MENSNEKTPEVELRETRKELRQFDQATKEGAKREQDTMYRSQARRHRSDRAIRQHPIFQLRAVMTPLAQQMIFSHRLCVPPRFL